METNPYYTMYVKKREVADMGVATKLDSSVAQNGNQSLLHDVCGEKKEGGSGKWCRLRKVSRDKGKRN